MPNISEAKFLTEIMLKHYDSKIKDENGTNRFSGDAQALNLGYLNEWFTMGVALEMGNFKFKVPAFPVASQYFTGGGIGTFLGFHFFNRIKIQSTYLNKQYKSKNNEDFSYFGQSVAATLGIRIVSGLMFNIEYFNNYFTQVENHATGATESLDPIVRTYGTNFGLSYIFIF